MHAPPRLLFVCYANACRSQMAEGWARALAQAPLDVASAGVMAAGLLPETVAAMAAAGIDIRSQTSKTLDALDPIGFDLVVTLSDQARGRLRRTHPGLEVLHRPVLDPVGVRGSREEIGQLFALTRDDVRAVVEEVLERLAIPRHEGI
jgi:arsenate reductase